jgi:hypothetical protein
MLFNGVQILYDLYLSRRLNLMKSSGQSAASGVRDYEDRDGSRNVGFIRPPDAADCPWRLNWTNTVARQYSLCTSHVSQFYRGCSDTVSRLLRSIASVLLQKKFLTVPERFLNFIEIVNILYQTVAQHYVNTVITEVSLCIRNISKL